MLLYEWMLDELYENCAVRIGGDNLPSNLCDIYREVHVVNFGWIIAHLSLVLKVSESCDDHTIWQAVRRIVEVFRHHRIRSKMLLFCFSACETSHARILLRLYWQILCCFHNVGLTLLHSLSTHWRLQSGNQKLVYYI